MPHTSHKKGRSPGKREVVGDDGWVRILPNRPAPKNNHEPYTRQSTIHRAPQYPSSETLPAGGPGKAPAASNISLGALKERVKKMENMWQQTKCHEALKTAVENYMKDKNHAPVETCVIFGSGSLCGVRDGFIERHGTAMLQLGVFNTVVNTIADFQEKRPLCYAQEPCYNDLDVQFLKSLGITVVEDPKGFQLAGTKTFAYTPAAEMPVEIHVLYRNPALFLSNELTWYWRDKHGVATTNRTGCCYFPQDGKGPTEHLSVDAWEAKTGQVDSEKRATMENECRIVEDFLASHDKVRIPDLDTHNFAVHRACLYYINSPTHEEGYDLISSSDAKEMPAVTPSLNDHVQLEM